MFTQCPECSTAFRVAAEILKKAAGQVRCGGCGIAFNALDYLSEERPESAPRAQPNERVPELTPETDDSDNLLPKTISAEQSAALLKTLDELAGSDIMIEDTGVEWRVLDLDSSDDEPDPDEQKAAESELIAATGALEFVIEGDDEFPAESPEVFTDVGATSDDMRFDDDTPLPDDFDPGDSATYVPETPPVEPIASIPEDEDSQADLAFGDPDEWELLLGEVDESTSEEIDEEEIDAAENTPPDVDTQFAIQAEAMGIDLSGMHESITDNEDNEATWIDEPDAETQDDGGENEPDAITLVADNGKDEPDVDSEPDEISDDDLKDDSDNEQDESEEQQSDIADAVESDDASNDNESYSAPVDDLEDATVNKANDLSDEDSDSESDEKTKDDELERSINADLLATAFEPEATQQFAEAGEEEGDENSGEHYVPPQTEEEKTINMMIDQDFMRMAAEGQGIFASTEVEDRPDFDDAQNVETIVMEGDFVQTALDRGKLAPDAAAGSPRSDKPKFSLKPASDETPDLRGTRRFSNLAEIGDLAGIGIIAGNVVLALILVVQVLHQSREALATVPTINQAIGPIYRAIGSPLTPGWDVAGWRFEVTKGSTDENDELLTIYSRVGNTSDGPLAYPLVHVSLTDRFEEIIGSKVLEPREYLAGNPDPSKVVESGSSFNAVISIESPAAEATGFKLNVCYRLADRQLRCAIEDFK